MEPSFIDLLEALLSSPSAGKEYLSLVQDIDLQDPNSGNSLLHFFVHNDMAAQVSLLLSYGASPNISNNNLETPLHWAAKNNCLKAAALLIDAGADINMTDKSGSCPIHYATEAGHSDMVAWLVLNPSCIATVEDIDGCNASMIAKKCLLASDSSNRNIYIAIVAFLQRHDVIPIEVNSADVSNLNVSNSRNQLNKSTARDFVIRAIEYDITQTIPIFTPFDTPVRRAPSPSKEKNQKNERTSKDDGKTAIIDMTVGTGITGGIASLRGTATLPADSPLPILDTKHHPQTNLPLRPPSSSGARFRNALRSGQNTPDPSQSVKKALPLPVLLPVNIKTPPLKGIWDCIVTVEHCWGCAHHNQSLRHDENRYSAQADACIEIIAEVATQYHLPVRFFACKVKADNKEGDCRIGALEVTLGFRYTEHLAGISESPETPTYGINFRNKEQNKSEIEQSKDQNKELKIGTKKSKELVLDRKSSSGKFSDSGYSQNNSANTSMKYPEDLGSSESTEWTNILLHSKLKSLCWPVLSNVRSAATLFLSEALQENSATPPGASDTSEKTMKELSDWVNCTSFYSDFTVIPPIKPLSVSVNCRMSNYVSRIVSPTKSGKERSGSETRSGSLIGRSAESVMGRSAESVMGRSAESVIGRSAESYYTTGEMEAKSNYDNQETNRGSRRSSRSSS